MEEVAVFASRARTGAACVQSLVERGYKVRAISRGGVLTPEQNHPNIVAYKADVTNLESLKKCVEGTQAVIFAAAASAGWRLPGRRDTPPYVDYQGCVDLAKVCVESNVKQYIIISSCAVSRSMFTSVPYLLLNTLFGRIMHWKFRAEQETKKICENTSTSYTIIRPGGLTDAPVAKPNELQILTGDLQSKSISRKSVAEIVASAVGNTLTFNQTFECVGGGSSNVNSYSDLFCTLNK